MTAAELARVLDGVPHETLTEEKRDEYAAIGAMLAWLARPDAYVRVWRSSPGWWKAEVLSPRAPICCAEPTLIEALAAACRAVAVEQETKR